MSGQVKISSLDNKQITLAAKSQDTVIFTLVLTFVIATFIDYCEVTNY